MLHHTDVDEIISSIRLRINVAYYFLILIGIIRLITKNACGSIKRNKDDLENFETHEKLI